jgi:hypothetical protein
MTSLSMTRSSFLAAAALLAAPLAVPLPAQSSHSTANPPPAMAEIRQQDLERDLRIMASDAMRGREAGTLDELRASVWLGEQMRQIGLVPKGDGGSWLQWWNIRRTRISPSNTTIEIGGRPYALWADVVPMISAAIDLTAPTTFVGDVTDSTVDLHGLIAVARIVAPPAASVRSTTNTHDYNYARSAIRSTSRALDDRGASAIILVADSITDAAFDAVARVQARGRYDVLDVTPRYSRNRGGAERAPGAPVLLGPGTALDGLRSSCR